MGTTDRGECFSSDFIVPLAWQREAGTSRPVIFGSDSVIPPERFNCGIATRFFPGPIEPPAPSTSTLDSVDGPLVTSCLLCLVGPGKSQGWDTSAGGKLDPFPGEALATGRSPSRSFPCWGSGCECGSLAQYRKQEFMFPAQWISFLVSYGSECLEAH